MDSDQFRIYGKKLIDFVADYFDNIRDRKPYPDVKQGFLKALVPDKAPVDGEDWDTIYDDIDKVFVNGMTHWQHPHFFAYYPVRASYPVVLADLLSTALHPLKLTWTSGPVTTELEIRMMDWLGKLLQLPEHFLSTSGGPGGGVIQGTASEACLVSLLAARCRQQTKYKVQYPDKDEREITHKFIAYTSEQAHTCVERAGRISGVKVKALLVDDQYSLRGYTLQQAIVADRNNGLIPIFICATLGTTPMCAFDNIQELGKVCEQEGLWMHIDAAYAGSAFICPELRPLLDGVEYAESIDINPYKMLGFGFGASALWVKDGSLLTRALADRDFHTVPDVNIDDDEEDASDKQHMPGFVDWHVLFGTADRALRLWFMMRSYGVKGLQNIVRQDVKLGRYFKDLASKNELFEILGDVKLGLVCFRLKNQPNAVNEALLKEINEDRRLHLTSGSFRNTTFLRFVVNSTRSNADDVTYAWDVIQEITNSMFETRSCIQG